MTHDNLFIDIDLSSQRLELRKDGEALLSVAISSAVNGPGELLDSHCTPRGWHEVCEKFGDDCEVNTVFVGRRPTGEVYDRALGAANPGRDWMLTRILWLSGIEPGRNQGGNVDTKNRYIYLHGCPDEAEMGVPGSIGCIRMQNRDVVALYDRVPIRTRVHIHE